MKKKHSEVWKKLHSYESLIFGYVKNAVEDAEIARDLCQDVFIQALVNMDQLDPDQNLYNWLKTVARNRIINYYRERKRRTFVELTESTIRTELETGNLRQTIEAVIKQMPEEQRDVFVLRELEGYNYKELSEHFDRSIAAVTSLLKRARVRFTRLYLLYYLPDWFRSFSADLSIEDIGRFINAFDPPLDLLQEIHRKSQKYFESIRQNWNKIRQNLFPENILDQIMQYLDPVSGKRVLDLGCGSGVVSAQSASLGKDVIGVDINKGMLEELSLVKHSLGLDRLHLIRGNITRLPLKNIQVDEIFLTLVLHHVADPQVLLQKISRLIRPEGHLIVVEYDRHRNRSFADIMHDLWMGFEPELIRQWCRKEQLTMVKSASWQAANKVNAYYLIFEKK